MARVIAITDSNGTLLGVLRADPVDAGNGITIQAVPSPRSPHRHHILDVPDTFIGNRGKGVEELHREVRRRLPA